MAHFFYAPHAASLFLELVLFDVPSVAELAAAKFKEAGIADRATVAGGVAVLKDLPQDADVISLIRVLLDHDDETTLGILKSARAALPQGGVLLVAEHHDPRRDYRVVCDVSGNSSILDALVSRLAPGGEIILAGFYADQLSFSFPPAFMKEARIRAAAQWQKADMLAVKQLVDSGHLSFDGLITHRSTAGAPSAYRVAFENPACLKIIIRLEKVRMTLDVDQATALEQQAAALRAEAAIEPDAVPATEVKKETQIIAIYGKGGIGKSFTLANLSYMMAQQGKRVPLMGCDPKSDTTSLLFGGRVGATIIETSSKKKAAGEEVRIDHVCFKRDGVFAMGSAAPKWVAAAVDAASSMVSSFSKNSDFTIGASITYCSIFWVTSFAADSACRSLGICAKK